MKYVKNSKQCLDGRQSGGKACALASLAAAGFRIPPFFVVQPEALLDRANVDALEINEAVGAELDAAMRLLADATNGTYFAVRSSAFDEDGVQHSFAGQFESYLYVKPEDVPARILDVWKSAFSERIIAYRKERGLSAQRAIPFVIVQAMVDSEVSGVAFSADPTIGSSRFASRSIVAAVYGLGHGLVSGELDADTHYVAGTGDNRTIEREIARKNSAYRLAPGGGIELVSVDEISARKSALTDEQILAVSQLARDCESHFGTPQDIEWAIYDNQVYLLQSRPITTIGGCAAPAVAGELRIFDNSNIGESYNGVTTPLTFSFARRAYENVYLQFCRILMVPEPTLKANHQVFTNMIGLIRGRIYYNLLNWYRVLAMLPGYSFNARFMEQMMGVKEALPQELVAARQPVNGWQRFADAVALVGSLIGLLVAFAGLKRNIKLFYARLSAALQPVALQEMTIDQLIAYYRSLEVKLLLKWDAPLVNDFFAMIFYGLLGALTKLMLFDANSSLQNDLLAQTGDIISAEPAARIAQMARQAAASPDLVEVLCGQPLPQIERRIAQDEKFKNLYDAYLQKFGDRCIGELKLESATLIDDPLPLLRSVGLMAKRVATGATGNRKQGRLVRRRAEKRVFTALQNQPLERLLFTWVLDNARQTVRNRENLRFERTRVFGRVRQIFIEIGKRLESAKLIDDRRDVFYLELNEIAGFADATTSSLALRELIAVRKQEFAVYEAERELPNRIEMRGPVGVEVSGWSKGVRAASVPDSGSAQHEQSELGGIPCCPGIVRGAVRVVLDPKDAQLREGEILVAKRTDPGWITLFPAASGLLVEHGSLLSHSAIVSRELGLPSIVSVPGICDALDTGDIVELNGSTGLIRIIERADRAFETWTQKVAVAKPS